MKIAQIAPPWLAVPPNGYGGTEVIVHYLTEGLVKKGHDVTLFASGDSQTSAKLHSTFPQALGNSGTLKNNPLRPLLHYIDCFEQASEFDIIHNHAQYYAMFLADLVKTPVVHTIHGSYTKEYTPEEKILTLKRFRDHNFVSISNSQRRDLQELNYIATVYNAVDLNEFSFSPTAGKYLLWLGRITSKKGPIDAIEVAKRLDMPLKMFAAIDPIEQEYFDTQVKPLIDGQLVTFEGHASSSEKIDIYKNALCTLYPIHWEEPFGLVMAESMACGTPVIAFNRGSVYEVVSDGVSGFIVDDTDDLRPNDESLRIKGKGIDGIVEAVKRIGEISREACRRHVVDNFSIERMVDGYERVYQQILQKAH